MNSIIFLNFSVSVFFKKFKYFNPGRFLNKMMAEKKQKFQKIFKYWFIFLLIFLGTTTIQNAESARFFIIHSGIFILVKLNLRFNSLVLFISYNRFARRRTARSVLQWQGQRLGALGLEERPPLVVVLESDALLGHEHVVHDAVGIERSDAATVSHTNALRHLL